MTILTSIQKAGKINADGNIYGTFAEIGAGQEVVSHFFKAGNASKTVAKAISAYDMTFSDSIYGREDFGRYVCQSRVKKMMKYEYDLLLERLGEKKQGAQFFSFANTVATKIKGSDGVTGHGWMGVKFKTTVDNSESEIVIHFKLHDNAIKSQQHVVGILGVNLLYACYYHVCDHNAFILQLMESLRPSRIEIDYIETKGAGLCEFDNRILNLLLVKEGITAACLFNTKGQNSFINDLVYKKNVMVVRGSFRPPTLVNQDMILSGEKRFSTDLGEDDICVMSEVTLALIESEHGKVDLDDVLARISLVNSMGHNVLVTHFSQYSQLSEFFSPLQIKNLAIVLGGHNFKRLLEFEYSKEQGGLLLAIGQMFRHNVEVFVYPFKEESKDEIVTIENLDITHNLKLIVEYLLKSGRLKNIDNFDEASLHIFSRDILKMIKNADSTWEKQVPDSVAKLIKENNYFR
jgi:hypothetical protein